MDSLRENWKVLLPRWTARIWSLGPIFITIIQFFGEDEHSTGVMTWDDYVNLGLLFICVLGLAIGWFFERTGAQITLGTLAIFIIFFSLTVQSGVVLTFIVLLGVPAVLYYLAWWMNTRR